jgi:hypothetical protein
MMTKYQLCFRYALLMCYIVFYVFIFHLIIVYFVLHWIIIVCHVCWCLLSVSAFVVCVYIIDMFHILPY